MVTKGLGKVNPPAKSLVYIIDPIFDDDNNLPENYYAQYIYWCNFRCQPIKFTFDEFRDVR